MDSTIGDLAVLAQLMQTHREQLLAMVRRRISPKLAVRIDPEEILSEAYLVAQRRYGEISDRPEDAYPWLFRIVLDCLLQAWRKESRGRRDLERDLPWPEESAFQIGSGLIDSGTSPSDAAGRNELCGRMQEVFATLNETDREILWLRVYEQLSFRDAAAVLRITENAATVRYVRALKRLKSTWNRHNADGR